MNESITFMGKQIERKQLFSQTYIIALLEDEGANFTTLANVRGWYIKQFGDELCISYPFVQGSHNGILILPVQEGFLGLPFDEVDEFTFEQFDLSSASILSAAAVADMEKNLKIIRRAYLRPYATYTKHYHPMGRGRSHECVYYHDEAATH